MRGVFDGLPVSNSCSDFETNALSRTWFRHLNAAIKKCWQLTPDLVIVDMRFPNPGDGRANLAPLDLTERFVCLEGFWNAEEVVNDESIPPPEYQLPSQNLSKLW
jgi:hypothetical protein